MSKAPSFPFYVSASARHKKTCPRYEDDPAFVRFYEAYPRKVKKLNAWIAWQQADKPDIQVILDAVEAQKGGTLSSREGKKFIPHPATWLNGRQWEDEIPPENGRTLDSMWPKDE